MRRTITLLALALTLTTITGCKNNKDTATETGTPESNKAELFAIADKFHEAFKKKDAMALKAISTEKGFYMGTDPNEVLNQMSFIDYLNKKLTNPAIGTIEYKVDRREINIDEDGQGAIIADQFTPIVFTQNIPWRMTAHVLKKDGKWIFDFISLSMTPNNDIVPAINIAAYQGQ
ncbi:nuclear transport factor 2 family protein [Flavobacterium sp. DG1-102-2]|uniref:nuclear transport factor 2 family protein n=1 Tax=Flavobacterium sp. DG1-102-2 TaxID=3081663 RepID=UPI002949918C|nr:nuclear transport factor 2 family protein [Flavobacterium sp. DG1-102-2]MDV6166847.1 nuclear transport factor 2 family protein [Flavobacterium sp. DG1-102-2]